MENGNEPLTLDRLNEDCLEQIFKRLQDVPEQLQVARVCQLFSDVIKRIWRHNPAFHTLRLEEWRCIFWQYEDLKYFLHAMRNSLTKIRIIEECLNAFLQDLDELGIKVLPSVQRCTIVQNYLECYPNSKDIEVLTKLLPNLQYLRITATICGHYLADFTKLEELHLYSDQQKEFEIENEFLHEICAKLKHLRVLDIRDYETSNLRFTNVSKCENLQELKLNLNTLKPSLHDILSLPKLKKLTVLLDNVIDTDLIDTVDTYDYKIYETDEFYKILDVKAESIVGIAVDNYYMPLTRTWDRDSRFLQYRKLKTFAFCNYNYEEDMLLKYTEMSELKLLACCNWKHLTSDTVLQFIKMCTKLEHLNLTYCKAVDRKLLYDALPILQQQKRERPLVIYYVNSGLDAEVEIDNAKFWRTQSYIKFSDEWPPHSDRGLSYIVRGFEFDFEC